MADDGPPVKSDTELSITVNEFGGLSGDEESTRLAPSGYKFKQLIGRGGMGEVVEAEDQRIGRWVAIKRMRSEQPTKEALGRFLREARIQARLDHPAVVPVYELGDGDNGQPFFTMKRLVGRTMEECGKPKSGVTQQALLRAFVEVCLALELAHRRGVVHRDIKPANIMLGDFGEVYVLDWGVAHVMDVPDLVVGESELGADTRDGFVLGTPGYMSPEQIFRASTVGPPADVYALGATLFELLTGEPLHPRGEPALKSTVHMTPDQASPAKRAPKLAIPPELDAACLAALAYEADDRPTARKLAERVQRYLDGDRDVEQRRGMAKNFLIEARAASEAGNRSEAVESAGRALALDPESKDAAALVASLILDPPKDLPAALEAELEATERRLTQGRGKSAFHALLLLAGLGVVIPMLKVAHWEPIAAIYLAIAANLGLAWYTYKTGKVPTIAVLAGSLMLTTAVSRLAGNFVLLPPLLCGTLMTLAAMPRMVKSAWRIPAYVCLAVLLPVALEYAGVLDKTAVVRNGDLVIVSPTFTTQGDGDIAALLAGTLGFVVVVSVFARRLQLGLRGARKELEMREWHLRQLLPKKLPERASVPRVSV